MLLEAVVDQGVEILHRFGPDIAAAAAIAAIGSAIFDELLAPERDAAVTAGAGLDIDLGDVEKFHAAFFFLASSRRMSGRCGAGTATVLNPARVKLDAAPVYMPELLRFVSVLTGYASSAGAFIALA